MYPFMPSSFDLAFLMVHPCCETFQMRTLCLNIKRLGVCVLVSGKMSAFVLDEESKSFMLSAPGNGSDLGGCPAFE